jgi:hypothetical protein
MSCGFAILPIDQVIRRAMIASFRDQTGDNTLSLFIIEPARPKWPWSVSVEPWRQIDDQVKSASINWKCGWHPAETC